LGLLNHDESGAGKKPLSAQPEPFNDRIVPVNAFSFQVIEQLSALTYQLQKPATGMMVLLVTLEVLGQISDPPAKQGDLHLGRARVRGVKFEILDNSLLLVRGHYHGLSSFVL
jgi:hypothetical protein